MKNKLLYPSHTLMVWKNTGLPAFIKIGNSAWEWWVSLDTDTDKPLLKEDGKPNRWAVKNTDEGINLYYYQIMEFKQP